MRYEELVTLPIEQIEVKVMKKEIKKILFDLNGFRYYFAFRDLGENKFIIATPSHAREKHTCPLCQERPTHMYTTCYELEPYADQLFARVIESNKLRLIWLYREYRFRKQK